MASIIESYKDLIYTIEQAIPFNRVLGIHLEEVSEDIVTLSFEMRPDLVGNFGDSRLHGGVISAAIDVVGGMAALVAVLGRAAESDGALDGFRKLGTIDLRVDYL
ncbi:MAG TPA: thioesterase family protein, partial [Actinobacteria bacterium]|nr:thioesterase family protein [Actinomycetota bacterium]